MASPRRLVRRPLWRQQIVAVFAAFLLIAIPWPFADAHQETSTSQHVVLTLFPSNQPQYRQVEAAIETAVQEINTNLIGGRRLVVRHERQQTDFNSFQFDQLNRDLAAMQDDNLVALMGLPTAFLVEHVGTVAGARNIPAITTSVSYRKAWNPAYYPSLFYAAPPDYDMPWMIKELMVRFVWRKVCIAYSQEFSALAALRKFANVVAPAYDIQVKTTPSVELGGGGGKISPSLLKDMSKLKDEGFIFLVGVNAHELLPVMQAANKAGIVTKGTAWIFLDMLAGPMLLSEELRAYLDGSLIIRPHVHSSLHFAHKLNSSNLFPAEGGKLENVTMEAIFAYEAALQFGKAYENWTEYGFPRTQASPERIHLTKNVSMPVLPNGKSLISALQLTLLGKKEKATTGYDIFNFRANRLVHVGEWTQTGLSSLADIVWTGDLNRLPEYEKQDVRNTSLRLLVGLSPPFSYKTTDPITGEERIDGVAIDLLNDIAVKAGFTYTLEIWEGDWNDMVELAGSETNNYDMAVGSITVTKYRSQKCDFTRSFFTSGLRMLTPRPKVEGSLFDFLNPFSWTVWLFLAITIIFSAIIMQLLDPDGIRTERSGHWFFDAIFFTSNVFLFVHDADLISKRWARIFLILLQFSMHILQSSYTANMASFLSSRTVENRIQSFFDLANYPVAVRGGGSNWAFVQERLGLRNLVPVRDGDEAQEKLSKGEARAYIADSPHIERIAATNCDTVIAAHQVDPQKYAFAMKKNSPWAGAINRAISVALANGIVSQSYNRHLQNRCQPTQNDNTAIRSLTLKNLGGIFLSAVIVAIILAPLKIYRLFKTTRKRPKFPLRSMVTQQVCYPVPSSGNHGLGGNASLANSRECILQLPSSTQEHRH